MGRGSRAGGLGQAVVGWFLSSHSGRRVSRWLFRDYERQRLSRPGPPSLGQAGSSRSPGPRDRALTWGARGRPAETRDSAARSLSSWGCTGSEPSQRSASSNDSTPKGSGPSLSRSPSHVLSPAGFHAEQSRGQALTGGLG